MSWTYDRLSEFRQEQLDGLPDAAAEKVEWAARRFAMDSAARLERINRSLGQKFRHIREDAMKGANPGQARKVDQNTKAYPGKLFPAPKAPPKGKSK